MDLETVEITLSTISKGGEVLIIRSFVLGMISLFFEDSSLFFLSILY